MLSSLKRLNRKGCTSSRVSGPPRFSSSTPTFSVCDARPSNPLGRPRLDCCRAVGWLCSAWGVRIATCHFFLPFPFFLCDLQAVSVPHKQALLAVPYTF